MTENMDIWYWEEKALKLRKELYDTKTQYGPIFIQNEIERELEEAETKLSIAKYRADRRRYEELMEPIYRVRKIQSSQNYPDLSDPDNIFTYK